MLALVQFIRKLFKQLKSDLTPTQLAVGAFLGVLAGLTPFGLHLILLFTIALLFNCSMAAFLFVMAVLKPVGLMLGGTFFHLGAGLLEGGGFYASIIQALAGAPVLAYLGFDRYVVAGAYAFAFPVAVMLGVMVRVGVASYRQKLAPKLADAAWYENAMKNRVFRFFNWVIAGKDKEFTEPKKRFVLFRPFRAYMVAFVPLLYIGITVGAGLYAQAAMQGIATDGVGRALGVQCTFGKVEYSFFGQRLAFENFQLPDPSSTKEDMVRVGGFEADLGFLSLLSKRLHIEKLSVRDVGAHLARNADGKLNVTEVPGAQPKDPAEKAAWEEWLQWLTSKGKDVDWSEVWNKYQEYRKKSAEKKREEEARGEKRKKVELPYDSDLRWEPERKDPLVRIDLIEIKGLALKVSDRSSTGAGLPSVTSVEAQGADLSSMPGWNGRPLTLSGGGFLGGGDSGRLVFRVSYLPSQSQVEFRADSLPVTDWRAMYEKTMPVKVEAGKASLATRAGVQSGAVDGVVNLQLDQLKVAAKPGETRILGLDPETSGYAIQGINAYGEKLPIVIGAAVTGPVEDPSVQAKLPFLEIAKKGLEMLGRKELQKYIDKLGGEVDSLKKLGAQKLAPLEGDFKNVQDQTIKALQTGDTKGVEEAVKKAQTDIKSLPDAKKDLEEKKTELKDALDLFKKKDKK